MTESDAIVIQTTGLTKTYKGVNALQSLDLKVPKHSIFGFLGPNGAGKSTTIIWIVVFVGVSIWRFGREEF